MKRWMLMLALVAPLALGAREVRVGTVVCNPGARVRVPVALDDASGAAGAAVALAFFFAIPAFRRRNVRRCGNILHG